MISRLTSSILVLLALVIGCKKSSEKSVDPYQYISSNVGQFVIYDVEESVYSAGKNEPVVKKWQERDLVTSKVKENETTTVLTITRFTRSTNAGYWEKSKEFMIKTYPDKVLTTLDNKTDLNLIFPLGNTTWNGNSFNNADQQKYHYELLNEPVSVSNLSFNNSITVVERRDSSAINKYTGVKKYALGVGLIYDDQIAYEYCQTSECLENDVRRIESGFHRTRSAIQFGTGY